MAGAREIVDRFLALQRAMYRGGDLAPLEELMADDIVWHVPGTSPIAGEHRGRAAVLAYFERRRALAGGAMAIEERGEIGDDDVVVRLADGRVAVDGRELAWRTAGVYRVANGRLAEAWLVPLDLAAFDAIWNGF